MTDLAARLTTALLSLLFLATGVGCRPDAAPVKEEPSTLTIVTLGGPQSDWMFNPLLDYEEYYLVYLPLAAINERGELEGRLAQSWELLPDDSSWTIRLRSDVRWHDGVPVTAHDIKFTMDLYQRPDVAFWAPGRGRATVLDDTTFTVTFRPGYAEEPEGSERPDGFLGYVYLPKHLLEGLDPATIRQWDFWLAPVGNGPYRFVRHAPQAMFELEANPDFYLGRPRIDRVIFKQGSGSTADLLSGNVDVMPTTLMLASQLAKDPRFRAYYSYQEGRIYGIAWNQDRYPPFRDRRVRRALTQAIDRHELRVVLDLPDDAAIYDVAMTHRQFQRGEYPEPAPYDPEAASRLLEAAGWRDEDGDGIRERAGKEFRFTMLARRGDLSMATYVQAALRRVGLAMEIEPTTVTRRLSRDADFEAGPLWAFGALRTIPFRLGWYLGPESPIGYHHPTVDSLIVRARATRSLDELDAIYRELMPILQEDFPITFLHRRMLAHVAHRRVRGLSTPWRATPYLYIDQLWLEDER